MTSMRPQVIAHRGASHDNAEHTLRAYTKALEQGADALECDVRLTADGHLVCVHDRRVDRVTNGRGVVSTMELAQLDELDFASWKSPWVDLDDEAPEVDEKTRRVLTLERLLQAAADYDDPVDLAIETKHPTRYGGLVERRLVETLACHRDRRGCEGQPQRDGRVINTARHDDLTGARHWCASKGCPGWDAPNPGASAIGHCCVVTLTATWRSRRSGPAPFRGRR